MREPSSAIEPVMDGTYGTNGNDGEWVGDRGLSISSQTGFR